MSLERPTLHVLPKKMRVTPSPTRKRMVTPPLRRGVYLLPNLVTTGGLFCGFFSVISTFRENYLIAAIAVLVALVCDALDGRIARLTHTTSPFGVQYDSLSDVIAFGVAPGVLAYRWALETWGAWGWLAASLYVTCGALRLARFNVQVDTADKGHFVGLPIPAAAGVIATTILMYYFLGGEGATNKHVTLLLLIYALGGLMVSTVPYYSFKDLHIRNRQPFWWLIAGIIVAFKLDRTGQVVASHVTASSGSPVLDDEAMAVLKRASPLPAPPDQILGPMLDMVLPIQFRIK